MENEATNFSNADDVRESTSFKFLEAVIHVDRHQIYLKHFNKNGESISESNTQKFLRYHHFDSFAPRTQKVGAIIETVIRMSRYSSKKSDLLDSIRLLRTELRILHYPASIFRKALLKIGRRPDAEPRQWAFLRSYISSLANGR